MADFLFGRMGRNPVVKARAGSKQKPWVIQILPFIKDGIRKLNVDDLCRFLGVSKATFYKSYESKDAFFTEVVEEILSTLQKKNDDLLNPKIEYQDRYIGVIFQVLEVSQSVTGELMSDLQVSYPALFAKIMTFVKNCDQYFVKFYEEGIKKKILRDYQPRFLASFNQILISEFTQPQYMINNNITFYDAFASLIKINLDGIFNRENPQAIEIRKKILSQFEQRFAARQTKMINNKRKKEKL